jgi:hypothetical protein
MTLPTTGSTEAIIVRDKFVTRMQAMPFFNGFNFSTDKAVVIDADNKIPFVGVYFIGEDLTPDGDANAGDVRFRSTAIYGFSVIIQNNDSKQAEYTLDQAYKILTVNMFKDPTLYNWKNVGVPGEVLIQAYVRGNRSHQFGNAGADNAMPVAELRFTLNVDLGTLDYDPVIVDDFETMHVTTQFPSGGTQEEIDAIQQVQAEYDLPQNTKEQADASPSEKRRSKKVA